MDPMSHEDWLEAEGLKVIQMIEEEEQLREAIQESHGDGEDFE